MKKQVLKRALILAFACVCLLSATGCWSYRGLNEMEICAGVAVDRDAATGLYKVTLEVINLTSDPAEGGIQTILTESEGVTLFESIRNAKKKLVNKLYLGSMRTVIISDQIAEKDGIMSVIEFFSRDGEPRETLTLGISKEARAADLLDYEGENKGIVCYKLSDIAIEDQEVTASSIDVRMYQAYNRILAPGATLVLPAFKLGGTDKMGGPEISGIAVFDGDRLSGYLGPDHSRLYLYVTDHVKGGLLSFDTDGDDAKDVTLEVHNSSTKRSFTYDGSKLGIGLTIETSVFIAEIKRDMDLLEEEEWAEIQHRVEGEMKKQLEGMILFTKDVFRRDIFDFGQMVYRQDPALYARLEKDWQRHYMDAEIRVEVKFNLLNSAFRR